MRPVRLFVLILALVLLPLRGWLGGAMGVEATVAVAPAAAGHAAPAVGHAQAWDGHPASLLAPTPSPVHGMHAVQPPADAADLADDDDALRPAPHGHESVASGPLEASHALPAVATAIPTAHHGAGGGDAPSHDHGHCGLCQICHSAAMAEAGQAAPVAPLPRVRPHGPALQFASAPLAQADKPPIS